MRVGGREKSFGELSFGAAGVEEVLERVGKGNGGAYQ